METRNLTQERTAHIEQMRQYARKFPHAVVVGVDRNHDPYLLVKPHSGIREKQLVTILLGTHGIAYILTNTNDQKKYEAIRDADSFDMTPVTKQTCEPGEEFTVFDHTAIYNSTGDFLTVRFTLYPYEKPPNVSDILETAELKYQYTSTSVLQSGISMLT